MTDKQPAACPFCGEHGRIERDRYGLYYPTCSGGINLECPAINMEQDEQGGLHMGWKTYEQAITAWNTRPASPAPSISDATLGDVEAVDEGELLDELADAITDSLDMDWTSSVGARAVLPIVQRLVTERDHKSQSCDCSALREVLTEVTSELEHAHSILRQRMGSNNVGREAAISKSLAILASTGDAA